MPELTSLLNASSVSSSVRKDPGIRVSVRCHAADTALHTSGRNDRQSPALKQMSVWASGRRQGELMEVDMADVMKLSSLTQVRLHKRQPGLPKSDCSPHTAQDSSFAASETSLPLLTIPPEPIAHLVFLLSSSSWGRK